MHTNHVDDIAHDSQMRAVVMQNNDLDGSPNHGQPTLQQLTQQVQKMGQILAHLGRMVTQSANRQAETGRGKPYTAVPNLEGEYPDTAPDFLPITNLADIQAAGTAVVEEWERFYFGHPDQGALPARRRRIAEEIGVNRVVTSTTPMHI